MIISKNKFISSFISLTLIVIFIYTSLVLKNTVNEEIFISYNVVFATIIFIIELFFVINNKKTFFNPIVLFLLSFYLFQNGQLLLYALKIDFNNFYIISLKNYMPNASFFSSISAVVAGFAGILFSNYNSSKIKNYYIDTLNRNEVVNAARLGFIVTSIISIPLVLLKLGYAFSGGYNAVRLFEGNIPSFINFFEYMFMPFYILLYSYSNKKEKFSKYLVLVWLLCTSLCGDRTTGIAGILILFYIQYAKNGLSKKQKSNNFKMIIVGLFLIFFIRFVYLFRTKGDISQAFTDANFFSSFISELGFSCFPLFTMMYTVPIREGFLLGQSYLLSFIGGCIPSFLDFTGIIKNVNSQAYIFESWQYKYFSQYNFGLGFSLNAESYINFGWYGLIVIFAICCFIFKMLSDDNNLKKKNEGWSLYKTSILLFLWFTLPRRSSYYIWKAISYSIVLIQLYLRLYCKKCNRG